MSVAKSGRQKYHFGVAEMSSVMRAAAQSTANRHALMFLEQLLIIMDMLEPDGFTVNTDDEIPHLRKLVDLLRELEMMN